MSNKIYVGNLPYSVTNDSLESNFAEFGTVTSTKIMMDRDSGRSKGFGFVEMASADASQAAVQRSTACPSTVAPLWLTWPSLVKRAAAPVAAESSAQATALMLATATVALGGGGYLIGVSLPTKKAPC